jgi:dynactin complex subunit
VRNLTRRPETLSALLNTPPCELWLTFTLQHFKVNEQNDSVSTIFFLKQQYEATAIAEIRTTGPNFLSHMYFKEERV